jgi:hypothetical protein
MTGADRRDLALRLHAGALGLPFVPTRSMLGSELLDLLLEQEDAVRLERDPFSGRPVVALAPLEPDVAIVHVDRADEAGNATVGGPTWGLREAACASRRTILLAEEVVPVGMLDPDAITIPGPFVYAVACVRWAACPTAAVGLYDYDRRHLETYMAAAREGGDAYARYLDEYVYGVDLHEQFLERAGWLCEPVGPGEMMAVAASQEIAVGDVVVVGLGLPQIASLLAKRTHAPGVTLVLGIGVLGVDFLTTRAASSTAARARRRGSRGSAPPSSSPTGRCSTSRTPACPAQHPPGREPGRRRRGHARASRGERGGRDAGADRGRAPVDPGGARPEPLVHGLSDRAHGRVSRRVRAPSRRRSRSPVR